MCAAVHGIKIPRANLQIAKKSKSWSSSVEHTSDFTKHHQRQNYMPFPRQGISPTPWGLIRAKWATPERRVGSNSGKMARFTDYFFRAGVGKSITGNQIQPQPELRMVNTVLKIWQKTTTATKKNVVREAYLALYRESLPIQLQSPPISLSLTSLLFDSWVETSPAQPSAPGSFTQQWELILPPKGKPIEPTAFSQLEEELLPHFFLSFSPFLLPLASTMCYGMEVPLLRLWVQVSLLAILK